MKIVIPLLVAFLLNMAAGRERIPASELPISVEAHILSCPNRCTILVTLSIPKRMENRWTSIEVTGPTLRGVMIPLKGLDSPTTFISQFDELPPGRYDVKGMLFDSRHEIARQSKPLFIRVP